MRNFIVRLRELSTSENNVMLLLAFAVGLLAGLGAIVMEQMLRFFSFLFLGAEDPTTTDLVRVVLAPVLGGLLVGPLVMRGAPETKGHGVPDVMEAVALRGGRIRGRVAVVKTVASAITIGSGGSAGREGPIVQIGAALGSQVGRVFRMSEERVRLLVAAGAAGGIAAAFNAPLAGVFFALEVILQRFTTRGFATVVVSAVTASVIWRARFGNAPVLDVPSFGLENPMELLFYVVLGIAAAVVALGFVRTLYWFEDRFDDIPLLSDLKPALGGLLLGGLGVLLVVVIGEPLVYGNGLLGIDRALRGELVWWALLVLLGTKVVATSFTLGSGGSGGVFAPSLFMGAMLGALFGQGLNEVVPGIVAPPGAYAMVGMAAVFAAAGQAPISAILILFEMTNDYRIILPLMLACIIATTIYGTIGHDSIYIVKIKRKGVDLAAGRERHLLERTPIGRAMIEQFPALELPATLDAARERLRSDGLDALVCVDGGGRFVGLLSIDAEDREPRTIDELLDDDVIPVIPNESLDDAFSKMAPRGLRVLPVLEDLASRRVIGVVTRESLNAAYWAALAREREHDPVPPRS